MRPAIVLLACLCIAVPAFAGVDGGDFDSMPPGPYPAGAPNATVEQGDPAWVMVVPAGQESGGAPTVPDGTGNVLCLDTIDKTGSLIVVFTFSCDVMPTGVCTVKYDYSGAAWNIGVGFEVHVDAGGVYNNPDDVWAPVVGFPPSTVFGSNTESAGPCDGSSHTIAFVVRPGTRVYIDNLRTQCDSTIIGVEGSTWGAVKHLFE